MDTFGLYFTFASLLGNLINKPIPKYDNVSFNVMIQMHGQLFESMQPGSVAVIMFVGGTK